MVIKFSNKTFDFITFKDIADNRDNVFPLNKNCKIRIAFSYVKPLKSFIYNYNSYSRNLASIKNEDFLCKLVRSNVYLDPFYGYIVMVSS